MAATGGVEEGARNGGGGGHDNVGGWNVGGVQKAQKGGGGWVEGDDGEMGKLWDMEKLQMYIAWVKRTIEPHLTAESERVLVDFFRYHRAASARNAGV